MADTFRISSSALPDDALCVAFQGVEALGRPYHVDVTVRIQADAGGDAFDRADALGAKATLTIAEPEGGLPFAVHGIVAAATILGAEGRFAIYELRLVPRLWLLGQNRRSRLFTKQSFVEVLEEVVQDGGLGSDEYELRLRGDYPKEEHICQYRESDLDFLHRWMELEGIYYFFEQGQDGEKLIVVDHASAHEMLADRPLTFARRSHSRLGPDHIDSLTATQRALPATVRLFDYDYANPSLELSAEADVSTGLGDVVLHNQRFFTPDAAGRYAKLRAEALQARAARFELGGTALYVRSGHTVEIENHPSEALNRRFTVVEARWTGHQLPEAPELAKLVGIDPAVELFRVRATLIPDDVPYRLPRSTTWPHVRGFENGVIDGAASSEYAQIDDDGRYLVKLAFDESSLKDGKASTYVRMLQPHGGRTEGFHFPLRKGTEVLLSFVGGDPDRPVIAGVLPNASTPSPVTAGNNTKNVIQTGGRNRIELEDLDGSQRVTMWTPTENTMLRLGAPNDDCNARLVTDGVGYLVEGVDFKMHTHRHKVEKAKNSVNEIFRGDFSLEVTKATTESYQSTKEETVHGKLTEKYKSQKTTVTGQALENYDKKHRTEVGGARQDTVTDTVTEDYKAKQSTTVDQAVTETFQAGLTQTITGDMEHKVQAKYTLTAADYSWSVGKIFENKLGPEFAFTIAATTDTFIGIKNENLVGGKFEINLLAKIERTLSLKTETHFGGKFELTTQEDEKAAAKVENEAAESQTSVAEVENTGGSTVSHGTVQGEV